MAGTVTGTGVRNAPAPPTNQGNQSGFKSSDLPANHPATKSATLPGQANYGTGTGNKT